VKFKKIVPVVILTLIMISMLTLAFHIQPSRASGTIYIRANGSIDPPSAPISTSDNITYTFTGNVYDEIMVERDNIVLDGVGHILQGTGAVDSRGIDLTGRINVTIKNMETRSVTYGIYLDGSLNNHIVGNNITTDNGHGISLIWYSLNNSIVGNNIVSNDWGISISYSSGNILSGNNMTNNKYGIISQHSFNNTLCKNNIIANTWGGINLNNSSNNTLLENKIVANTHHGLSLWNAARNNTVFKNNITDSFWGILIAHSSNHNNISDNNIANNDYGIILDQGVGIIDSSNNFVYHNNFVDNTHQVSVYSTSTNHWDDNYPSGGNYWSDYVGTDLYRGPYQNVTGSDGIGDIPYVIDVNNKDSYPLMKPYPWATHDVGITSVTTSKTIVGQGYNMSITVMLFNYGNYIENINITINANSIIIGEINNIDIASRNFTIVTFTWNTSGFVKGNYTISAYAWPVLGEIDETDNTLTDGWVVVAMVGDISSDIPGVPDGKVDMVDMYEVAKRFGINYPDPRYVANYDIDGDDKTDMADMWIAAKEFGKIDP